MGLAAAACAGCGAKPGSGDSGGLRYAVSIPPLAAILRPIVGDRGEVTAILPANASPHTYEARPSDAAATEGARALFYVSDDLDGWAVSLPSTERIAVMDLLPATFKLPWPGGDEGHDGHDHEDDPHFWSDPIAVAGLVFLLGETLADLEGDRGYADTASRFAEELTALHGELVLTMAPVRGAKVVSFHPSWNYFLSRYGIENAGYIEASAGKEIAPRDLQALIETAKASGAKAILTEPQLAPRPAEVVSEATGIPVVEIDPLGGRPGRETYRELLTYNADVMLKALS